MIVSPWTDAALAVEHLASQIRLASGNQIAAPKGLKNDIAASPAFYHLSQTEKERPVKSERDQFAVAEQLTVVLVSSRNRYASLHQVYT